jgi:nitroreductase
MAREPEPPRGPRTIDGWFVTDGDLPSDPLARLVYYARLAPSSHNSQPWRFVAAGAEIDVFADQGRWLRVADADRRELHLSLGCALESLLIAGDFAGYGTSVAYFPLQNDETLVGRVSISTGGPKRDDSAGDLLKPMITRRTSHQPFDRLRPVVDAERRRLERCFESDTVSLHFLDERAVLERLAGLEARADALLFARPEYRNELAHWVGQGMLGTSWIVSKLGQFAVGHLPLRGRVAHEDAERLANAPVVALLSTPADRPGDQVQAGQAFMRIALAAESRDIRVQPVSQALEVAETRAELARLFGAPDRAAQLLFRLGHAPAETHRTPRRPLDEILVRAAQAA